MHRVGHAPNDALSRGWPLSARIWSALASRWRRRCSSVGPVMELNTAASPGEAMPSYQLHHDTSATTLYLEVGALALGATRPCSKAFQKSASPQPAFFQDHHPRLSHSQHPSWIVLVSKSSPSLSTPRASPRKLTPALTTSEAGRSLSTRPTSRAPPTTRCVLAVHLSPSEAADKRALGCLRPGLMLQTPAALSIPTRC